MEPHRPPDATSALCWCSNFPIKLSADICVQWFNVTAIEYGLTIMLVKLSILMLYRRIFIPPRWSALDITLRALECVLVLFYVSISIVKIAQCTPREKIWNRKLPGRCINVNYLLNTSGMFNFLTDVLILLIPVKSVWKLQMKKKKKIQIVVIFTVGAVYVLSVLNRRRPLPATLSNFPVFHFPSAFRAKSVFLLTMSSAPVFSMIGFLVRLRYSTNPDVTFTQPSVLLWGQVSPLPF
jgi:hypothetical protein